MWDHHMPGALMRLLPLIEVVMGIIALLFAGAAFVNLSWSEGASSAAMKREAARKTKRLFIVSGIFALLTLLFYYLSIVPTLPAG
jgi:hypothetical protein